MSDQDNGDPPDQQPEPKLVVDSDWKEQVAREKEQAAADAAQSAPGDGDATAPAEESAGAVEPLPAGEPSGDSAADDSGAAQTQASDHSEDGELPAPPPASFEVLVSMLFTQALAMLGQMPDPATGQPRVNKPFAKHYIDSLDMLSEKTRGNLTDDEQKVLSEALHALRMTYVNVK
jgi:hypothetical protein